jgi:hypothetical protein
LELASPGFELKDLEDKRHLIEQAVAATCTSVKFANDEEVQKKA